MLVVVQADWPHIPSEFAAVIRLFSDYSSAFGHQLPPFVTIGLKFSRRYLAYTKKMVGDERHSSSLSISGGPLIVCISWAFENIAVHLEGSACAMRAIRVQLCAARWSKNGPIR
jgi:hypothetical protein